MTEETAKEVFLTLDFSGTEKKFADIDELSEFMESEKNAWSWLEQVARKDDNLAHVRDPYDKCFKYAGQFIKRCMQHPNDEKKQINWKVAHLGRILYYMWSLFSRYLILTDQFIKRYDEKNQTILINVFRSQIQTAVVQGLILSETPNGRFVLDLKDNASPEVAGYALASLNNTKVSSSNLAAHEGAYWTMKYLQGSTTDSVEAQQKIHDSVARGCTDRLEKQHENLGEKNKQLIKETTELQGKSNLLIKEVDKQRTKLVSDIEIMRNNAKKRLTNLEASFTINLELAKSVDFWKSKRVQHNKEMRYMAIATLSIAIGTAVMFQMQANEFLRSTPTEIASITPTPSAPTPGTTKSVTLALGERFTRNDLWRVSIMLLISTFGIWLTRLFAKIFISNLHLRMDADERVTMFQTYFALLENGEGLNDDDRELILQALFRPTSTGFVKDDGPASIPETLVKAFKRR